MPTVIWPPDHVMPKLVEQFFTKTALMLPIINRESFEKSLRDGLHKTDVSFAKLALMLCAVASRFVDDPEVCMNDDEGNLDKFSAGWKYFTQVYNLRGQCPSEVHGVYCMVNLYYSTRAIACAFYPNKSAKCRPHLHLPPFHWCRSCNVADRWHRCSLCP